ncbi:MAG TPA: hypothetical protein VMK65_11375 [Longimicrobiales bacterium]|nr:hypothetical protein [Longimicrobiales bacterium]
MAGEEKRDDDTPVPKEMKEGQRPSEQADGSPKPRDVTEEPSQQGQPGRSGGTGGGRGDTEATGDQGGASP